MKIVFTFLIFCAGLAHAESKPECYQAINDFNKRYSGKMEFAFLDFGSGGMPLFQRMKEGFSPTNSDQADSYKVGGICMKAGFSRNIYIGKIGSDMPKTLCQVVNLNTMGTVCDKMKVEG